MSPEIIVTGAALTAAGKIKEDSLLGMLYKDTLQPSVQALGKALGSTIEFCTTPLLLCKLGSEVARLNYQKHLDNYAEKIKYIPDDERIAVNPQIGVPILERLTYVTNDEIANLFTTLLASASSSKNVNLAHPVFIQMISALSVDEALIVSSLLKTPIILWATRMVKTNQWGYIEEFYRRTLLAKENALTFPQNLPLYMDNLVSLGTLSAPQQSTASVEGISEFDDLIAYNKFQEWEDINLASYGGKENTRIAGGFYRTSDLGKTFVNACCAV